MQSNDPTTVATKVIRWIDPSGKSLAEMSMQNNGVLRTVEIGFGFDICPALGQLTNVTKGISSDAAQQ